MTEGSNITRNSVIDEEYILTANGDIITPEFYNPPGERPPIPTENGWINLFKNEKIRTIKFNMSNSPQFTIQFEVFPLKDGFSIEMKAYEENGNNLYGFG